MFQLMCKDNVVATFDLRKELDVFLENLTVLDTLPFKCNESNLLNWLNHRNAAKHRKHLNTYLIKMGANDIIGFLRLTHGISINDCFWIKEDSETISWSNVSPYSNEYSEVIQKLAFLGSGLFGEEFSETPFTSPDFSVNGAFNKCWIRENGDIYMLKRGSTGAINAGFEPYSEVLASQVFEALKAGIPYALVKYQGEIASKCKLFNSEDLSFVAHGDILTNYQLDVMLKYYDILGTDQFRRILIADALTLNTDRHVGNHGLFYIPGTRTVTGMAPGYDYNLSMCPTLLDEDFMQFSYHYFTLTPRMGDNFIRIAHKVLTPQIRKDLINLKGLKLKLPFYDNKFSEERCDILNKVFQYQIDNVLSGNTKIPKFNVSSISNIMRYRLKYDIQPEDWRTVVLKLMDQLGIIHMYELEEAIIKLI